MPTAKWRSSVCDIEADGAQLDLALVVCDAVNLTTCSLLSRRSAILKVRERVFLPVIRQIPHLSHLLMNRQMPSSGCAGQMYPDLPVISEEESGSISFLHNRFMLWLIRSTEHVNFCVACRGWTVNIGLKKQVRDRRYCLCTLS